MTGSYEASKKRAFTDCSTEMVYVNYIEPGQPKKAPFVLRTDDQLSMFFLKANQNLSHSLLCQPVGICTEFSRNIYVADSGSGSIKLINRPLHSMVEFLSNLQTLLTAFHIHAKGKSLLTTHHTVSEAIEMVNQTLEYVKSCSLKAKKLQHLVTNCPEGTVSSKSFKSLEPLKKALQKMEG